EFTPAMLKGAFDHILNTPAEKLIHRFTLGIEDDVTHRSLPYDESFDAEPVSVYRAKFFGLGSDGTVGANKNSIKIIGDVAGKSAQGYFVYDSKKAGGITVSHLRFSDVEIQSPYLITKPDFVAIHKKEYIGTLNVLKGIKEGGTVLINSIETPDKVLARFPRNDVETIINKKLKVYLINAHKLAAEIGLGERINVIMQTAFFKLTGILPEDVFKNAIEDSIRKTYSKKGEKIVNLNIEAMNKGLAEIHEVPVPAEIEDFTDSDWYINVASEDKENEGFINDVIKPVMHFDGDTIPVSKMPPDGVFPTGTTRYEKRSIAVQLPDWNPDNCIQCAQCAFVCPHAAILATVDHVDDIGLSDDKYQTLKFNHKDNKEGKYRFRIQVAPDDCTGCGVCFNVCPGKRGEKALKMVQKEAVLEPLRESYTEFMKHRYSPEEFISDKTIRTTMLEQPLLEFSGACPGCGETPYVKLMTMLQGDHTIQTNATGCSSIWGGTAPTIPFCRNSRGEGPAWSNSLFEDNAEFGLGMRLSVDHLNGIAFELREKLLATSTTKPEIMEALNEVAPLKEQRGNRDNFNQTRNAVDKLKKVLEGYSEDSLEGQLLKNIDMLTKISQWVVGGDGWAYDIGYGGLDHTLASGKNVNI
ncbi:MAG: 2-oxoacid:acceptor oxidoreductase family protein, partial [Holophagae bacterium]|nr:2-oxoacid:acceptor oxidoreductase family protein [Holophagae bacterium]